MKRILLVLVLCWPVVGYSANYFTGNDMMKNCVGTNSEEPNVNLSKYNSCVMYLAGVADAEKTYSNALQSSSIAVDDLCLPYGVTLEQIRQVFMRYMQKHPGDWHWNASNLVHIAFAETWFCDAQ